MPNGYEGTEEKWKGLEAPLFSLDPVMAELAKKYSLQFTKNSRNWPDRSLRWSHKGINKLLQIFPADQQGETFSFWLVAEQDRNSERYWKNQFLKENVPFSAIERNLPNLLHQGVHMLNSWAEEQLEFAAKLPTL